MNTEVATMASIQEKVKERIQASFVDLIPQEMWEGMVQQHLKDFTTQVLPKLVKDEAEKRARELLIAELGKPGWVSGLWGPAGPEPSPLLLEVIKQAAPDLVAALFGNLVQQMVMNLRNTQPRY
jgi:hypothetical protein